MAKQEECSKCARAKQGGYAGEIKCSFYGRKPQFDDNLCPNYRDREIEESSVKQDATNTVSQNDHKDFPNAKLFTPNAESVVCKYGNAIKTLGLGIMIVFFVYAIVVLVMHIGRHPEAAILDASQYIVYGISVFLLSLVVKALINVFVNISITLQDINRKIKENS